MVPVLPLRDTIKVTLGRHKIQVAVQGNPEKNRR
jgi:hypothetical protein